MKLRRVYFGLHRDLSLTALVSLRRPTMAAAWSAKLPMLLYPVLDLILQERMA